MDTTLIVLAAGIGQRYGAGIKQLAQMDKNGYTIIDYSIYDAIKAGFSKVVFIIRPDIEKDFKEIIGKRIEKIIPVGYAYQNMDLPGGFISPESRKKPWGTVDAVLSCKDLVKDPFLVINADDYYGKEVFKKLHDFLVSSEEKKDGKIQIAMAGYKLKNTLSEHGTVTRGVCTADDDKILENIIETHEIEKKSDGSFSSMEALPSHILNDDTLVSMNLWASFPDFIDLAEDYFIDFLEKNKDNLEKAEYVLPVMIGQFLEDKKAEVKILPTKEKWIGITYKEDLAKAQDSFRQMLELGLYPKDIWENFKL